MMRELKFLLLPMSALLLSACTGEKQNTRTAMQDREIILINQSYPQDICMSQKLKDVLQKEVGLTNALMRSTENSVNCAYFSRTPTSCVKFSFTEKYPDACVIAADRVPNRKNERINGKDVADLMISLIEK